MPADEPGGKQAVDSAVDRLKSGLGAGNIAYNAPESMRLDETVTVSLKLSKLASIIQLKAQLTNPGEKRGAEIMVGPKMRAMLSGARSAFDIVRLFRPIPPSGG